jgi:hypothetical protein
LATLDKINAAIANLHQGKDKSKRTKGSHSILLRLEEEIVARFERGGARCEKNAQPSVDGENADP